MIRADRALRFIRCAPSRTQPPRPCLAYPLRYIAKLHPFDGAWPLRAFTAVIECDPDTALFVGYVPGFPGAHSQGATLDELVSNCARC